MPNEIVRLEQEVTVMGYKGRAFNVVMNTETGIIRNQKIILGSRGYTSNGDAYRLSVELRFDDECGNGHESFAITATRKIKKRNGQFYDDAWGCLHEEIAKAFPKLAYLIPWHLCSTDGPMHYIANTCYFAGDADCNGRRKGDVDSWRYAVTFGNSPALHMLDTNFYLFLAANLGRRSFQAVSIEHEKDAGDFNFKPKWTIDGYGKKWHECPFDTEVEAIAFADALNKVDVYLKKVPQSFSQGKERELDKARDAAIWKSASDDMLCLPRPELEEVLKARLPHLISAFKSHMQECGFLWPARVTVI